MSITGWKQVYNYTVTGSAVTSLTISGLDGDTAGKYKLSARIVNGYNGGVDYLLRPNNVSTADNYGRQFILGADTATSAARDTWTGMLIGSAAALTYIADLNLILQSKSG